MSKTMHSLRSAAPALLARRRCHGPAKRGFTLIELMIVVAIVAILAAVALPSYKNYILRGQLQEAFANLSDYRIKMEQYYQDNKVYGTASACATDGSTAPGVGPTTPTWSVTTGSFTPTNHKYFSYTCVIGATPQLYTFFATSTSLVGGTASQYIYTINQDGTKATTTYKGAAPSPAAACWLSNSSSC